ncbi:unnamed protein product [Ceratitis capitata]|uniref:(Mediterranean fruit fly) hypothetical protein n=1 Tax=Ceratitis capitata TaxID=7213 RepID=A0A811UEL2_CERCA|nr:unnamed protein product [Ceratitis capitata]
MSSIKPAEIRNEIEKLNNKKSPGYDKIDAKVAKCLPKKVNHQSATPQQHARLFTKNLPNGRGRGKYDASTTKYCWHYRWSTAQQVHYDQLSQFNQNSLNSPKAPSCTALPEEVGNACGTCQEKLELFYDNETNEWNFRNAIRVDDKIYHPLCYEDHKGRLFRNPTLNANDDEHD